MKYSEIISYPRGWDQGQFPVVAHLEIEAERFTELERRVGDQTQARVLGHDLVASGIIVAHVGCTSEQVRRNLEGMWT